VTGREAASSPRVLHVLVGHGLPTYFRNAVRSIRRAAPGDPLLIIDNASPDPALRDELTRIAGRDDLVEVILRTTNDLALNGKVGSLYSAYEIAFSRALSGGFDLLHLLQADFQMLWWDADFVAKSGEIFDAHPRCVNIETQFLSRDRVLAGGLAPVGGAGLMKLSRYGLSDTGLYHLGRWQARSMSFGAAEMQHGRRYLDEGLEVLCHPWPTDAPIPWPAVVRGGVRQGREIPQHKPYLLKPPSPEEIAALKRATSQTWLEDVCIPWGWVCATPMWVTGLDTIDYWVLRYRDARKNGLRRFVPRLERRGVDRGDRRKLMRIYRYRPSVFRLLVAAPAGEITRRLRQSR
jgi:hypothetical protein